MIQEIITYAILAFSFGFVILKFAKFIFSLLKNKNQTVCASCSSFSCSSCAFAQGNANNFNFAEYNRQMQEKVKQAQLPTAVVNHSQLE